MIGYERILSLYKSYFDHFESQYYSNKLNHKTGKSFRQEAKTKFIKYAFKIGFTSLQLQEAIRWNGMNINNKLPKMTRDLEALILIQGSK